MKFDYDHTKSQDIYDVLYDLFGAFFVENMMIPVLLFVIFALLFVFLKKTKALSFIFKISKKAFIFIKLHFTEICLFVIAISLLKIAFFNDDVQKITNAIRGIDMICY